MDFRAARLDARASARMRDVSLLLEIFAERHEYPRWIDRFIVAGGAQGSARLAWQPGRLRIDQPILVRKAPQNCPVSHILCNRKHPFTVFPLRRTHILHTHAVHFLTHFIQIVKYFKQTVSQLDIFLFEFL